MKYVDISQTIVTGMKKYPSDPSVEVRQFKSLKKGDHCNLSKLVLGSHTGTHIDAPRHIFSKGKSIDNIGLKDLICDVVVVSSNRFFKQSFFKKINLNNIKGVLLKKGQDRIGLTMKVANKLVKKNIRVIGTEHVSIEKSTDKSHPVHRLLLSKGCAIIEGLDLRKVKPGYYRLICLPLKIKSGDGAPARAILAYD